MTSTTQAVSSNDIERRLTDRIPRTAFWIPAFATAVAAVWLAVLTYRVSASPTPADSVPDGAEPPPLWEPDYAFVGDHSPALAWTVAALLVLSALVYVLPRRRRIGSAWIVVGVMTGAVVVLLGIAAYLPCVGGSESAVSLPGWVLGLFVGAYEFDGPAKACAMRFAPGFSLARSLGVLSAAGASAGIIVTLLSERIGRFRVRVSDELDVVIGLNDASLPLVRSLVDENKRSRSIHTWVDRSPGWKGHRAGMVKERVITDAPTGRGSPAVNGWWWWWLTGLRRGDMSRLTPARRLVVVLDGNDSNPLLGEARQAGAIVLTGDPLDREVLRGVAITERLRGRRVSFHRMYAVSVDQGLNLDVERLLRDLFTSLNVLGRRDQALPRLFVRMDDERQAQRWRISRIQQVGADKRDRDSSRALLVRDAVTVDGLAAIAIIETLLPPTDWTPQSTWPTHLALVGDGSLSLACLDELAWQLWTRLEIAVRAKGTGPDPKVLDSSHVVEVALFGETTGARCDEWQKLRGAWDRGPVRLSMFEVTDQGPATDHAVGTFLAEHPGARAVFVDPTPEYEAMSARLARTSPPGTTGSSRVIAVRQNTSRRRQRPLEADAIRLAAGLVMQMDGTDTPPTDSMTRYAHQQHRAYRGDWAETHVVDPSAERRTNVPWSQLPEFFREENVRQYWRILSWFNSGGRRWEWGRDEGDLSAHRDPELLMQAAADEYARWADTRRNLGWWPAIRTDAMNGRHDGLRLHPDLRGWDLVDQKFNADLAGMIVDRMMAIGLFPSRCEAASNEVPDGSGAGRE